MNYPELKRILDILLSVVIIYLFFWLYAIIAIAIILEDGGAVLFKQKRVGKDKSYFYIYKFRTMKQDSPKDVPTHLLVDPDKYITRVGAFLRKTSLDELPQIINILKGDMSFVGPRPALYNQYDLIELRDIYKANSVLPGLTGLAQINGRDELELETKAKYDGEYVRNMSLAFDIKILLKTVVSVFTFDGVREGKQ
ncbi:MAG TPA: lipid carrier--UDP-N-acetylgalactosaminyltransferase [Lachnospiraceae bacterium]|nr:lipid carrier--UDP-N-acetylgalactosaminyltransferase [Lachnospiraceae bacterium]